MSFNSKQYFETFLEKIEKYNLLSILTGFSNKNLISSFGNVSSLFLDIFILVII